MYVIESYKEKKLETFVGASDHAFEVQARINVFSEKEAREWLSKFFEHSNCTYRFSRGVNKAKCKRVVYKAFMHCQHQKKAPTAKQIDQPKNAQLSNPVGKLKKQEDIMSKYLKTYCNHSN